MMAARWLTAAAAVLTVAVAPAAAGTPRTGPGDPVTIAGGVGGCTLGFLFRGSDNARYMSTAGHCLLGETQGRRTWRAATGPEASTPAGKIGHVVFAENVPTEAGDDYFDFALIRLDEAVRATPELKSYGVPTGVNDSRHDGPVVLRMTGQGTGVSLVASEREVVAPTLEHPDHVYAHGPVLFGDSGAPVIDEHGAAVGTVLGAGSIPYSVGVGSVEVGHDGALNRIGRLPTVLRHASISLRVRFQLVQKAP